MRQYCHHSRFVKLDFDQSLSEESDVSEDDDSDPPDTGMASGRSGGGMRRGEAGETVFHR